MVSLQAGVGNISMRKAVVWERLSNLAGPSPKRNDSPETEYRSIAPISVRQCRDTAEILVVSLAALVPRPRVNLTRFHGVFSPNSKLREYVVPQKPVEEEEK
jgi:hypothetical protein|tara:strand:- start:1535 stop:1840 length:306 start_codon:yes stop_codon:yes gene_type:complete